MVNVSCFCCTQEQLLTMNIDHLKRNVVEFLVSKSLDYKDHHRELISTLISVLYSKVLSSEDIADGFDDVLCHLADLAIDIPDADGVSFCSDFLRCPLSIGFCYRR